MPRIFDASELTRQRQLRTIYTNVVSQQQAFNLGLTNHIEIVDSGAGGGGTDASTYGLMASVGPTVTTVAQRDAAINAVIPPPTGPPPVAPRTSITARYIKFSVMAVSIGGSDPAVAGFQVLLGGTPVSFNGSRSVRMVDFTTNAPLSDTASTPANFVNGYLTSNKAFPFLPASPAVSLAAPRSILIDNTDNITFSAYKLAVADVAGRDPIRWRLETSTDGVTYEIVDDRTSADVSFTRPSNYSLIATAFTPSVITG
jgi:hypothetical protein